jgi:hypothetical protein
MRRNLNAAFIFFISLASSASAVAAERGDKFDSYRDMHSATQYGSLFLNEGSIRYQDSRSRKRFVKITGVGELNLPSQEGYCFVFNHYDSPNGNGVNQKYRLKISKLFADGKNTEQKLERDYAPTDDVVSSNLPDWCIAGTTNVSKVSLEFSSDDGYFNRAISFVIR